MTTRPKSRRPVPRAPRPWERELVRHMLGFAVLYVLIVAGAFALGRWLS